MRGRKYLNDKIELWGEGDNGTYFPRTFRIKRKISRGAACICYEAYHVRSGVGILKEFLPKDMDAIRRDRDGYLAFPEESSDTMTVYAERKEQFLRTYEELLKLKQDTGDADLNRFIPPFEIYHSRPEKPEDNVYIWSPEPELKTFKELCGEIHKNPQKEPEHKLFVVLCGIRALTKSICSLHTAGFIHGDINPSNFGFIKVKNEAVTGAVSLFDVDTVHSVYDTFIESRGTKGYVEPEAACLIPGNQTDIFAIGASLFNAIIVTDELKENGYLYNESYLGRLRGLINESKLISASELNSDPRLRDMLTSILYRCLSERRQRYQCCEDLLEDIEKALKFFAPAGAGKASGKKSQKDIEKELDKNADRNSRLAIQHHLYKYPLYQAAGSEEHIRILITGFGTLSQKFTDVCLEAGQMAARKPCLSILYEDAADKSLYLKERPELGRFFDIDSSMAENEGSYGKISFNDIKQTIDGKTMTEAGAGKDDKAAADIKAEHFVDYIRSLDEKDRPHYVFIDAGDDRQNRKIAGYCRRQFGDIQKCVITYAVKDKITEHNPRQKGPIPLCADRRLDHDVFFRQLENMAFNTHLIWEKGENIDIKVLKREFRKSYNHDSCIAFVLSLKYKLNELGIDIDALPPEIIAAEYEKKLASDRDSLRDRLILAEHKRWVTEKLCRGWRSIRDLSLCLTGETKDERHKRHICILKSRPGQELEKDFWTENDHEAWDRASEDILDQLDELDLMSVRLHRVLAAKAKEVREKRLISQSDLNDMRELCSGDMEALRALGNWAGCLKDIWEGKAERAVFYKGYLEALLSAIKNLSNDRKTIMKNWINTIDKRFYPVRGSFDHRDFKQDDTALIDRIPFILTYQPEKADRKQ